MDESFVYCLDIYNCESKSLNYVFDDFNDLLYAIDMERKDSKFSYCVITKSNFITFKNVEKK